MVATCTCSTLSQSHWDDFCCVQAFWQLFQRHNSEYLANHLGLEDGHTKAVIWGFILLVCSSLAKLSQPCIRNATEAR